MQIVLLKFINILFHCKLRNVTSENIINLLLELKYYGRFNFFPSNLALKKAFWAIEWPNAVRHLCGFVC